MKIFITILISISINYIFADWVKVSSLPTTYVKDIFISGATIYAVSYNGVYKSTDGTASWQAINDGLANIQALSGYQLNVFNNSVYLATMDGIYKSTNGGINWLKKSSGIVVGGGSLYAYCQSIFENGGVLYTGCWTGIYRSTDLSESWQPTNITGSGIGVGYFLNYNGTLFAARESINIPGSYKSSDNGLTWVPFSIHNTYLPAITFFNDGPRLYAGTIDGVWLSANNGLNWSEKNSGLTLDPYSSSIIRVNGILLTSLKFGGSGIFKSFNNGDTWLDIRQGLPFLGEIDKIIQFNNKILAGTSDGLYQMDVSELTGIKEISSEVPDKFGLSQNFPNPFNPSTHIRFNIPYSVLVNLSVYNILGEETGNLVNQQLEPGTYEVNFNGSNLPSGIYFYSLITGNYKEIRKMVLAK